MPETNTTTDRETSSIGDYCKSVSTVPTTIASPENSNALELTADRRHNHNRSDILPGYVWAWVKASTMHPLWQRLLHT